MLTQKCARLEHRRLRVAGLVQADQHHRRFQRQRADRARGGAERRAVDGRGDHRDAAGEPPDDVAVDLLVGQRSRRRSRARLRFRARPTTPWARSFSTCSAVSPSRSVSTASVSAPSAGPAQRTPRGSRDSRGTTRLHRQLPVPLVLDGLERARAAWKCGSSSMSFGSYTPPAGTPAACSSLEQLRRGEALGPARDDRVDRVHVASAGAVVDEARVGGQLGHAHHVGEPREDRVLVGGDEDLAVAGRVDVARGDAGQRRAGALAHGARGRTTPRRATRSPPAPTRRCSRRRPGRGRCGGAPPARPRAPSAPNMPVSESPMRDADPDRRQVGVAGERPQAAHRLADRGVARPAGVRPGLAEAADPHHDQLGPDGREVVPAQPPALEGARAGSSRRGCRRARRGRGRAAGPPVVRRSTVMLRLLRPATLHHSESPVTSAWPHWRSTSPLPGGSTLMTSAPRSPSICAQKGPAITCPSSMTLMPESGPATRSSFVARITPF